MLRHSMNEFTTMRWSFEDDVVEYSQAGFDGIGIWRQKLSDIDEEEAIKQYDHLSSLKLRTVSIEEWREKNTRDAEKLRVRVKKLEKHISARLLSSKRDRNMVPRFEQIFEILRLAEFDRFVVLSLVAATIKPDPKLQSGFQYHSTGNTVEYFLSSYTSSLEVSVRCRRSFYKSSPLIKEGILFISGQGKRRQHCCRSFHQTHSHVLQDFSSDLNKCSVGIDRRFVDYICVRQSLFRCCTVAQITPRFIHRE